MRTFGFAVATVLCAIQLTAALPRPDFGLSIDVYSADKTSDVADAANNDLVTLWSTSTITLNANYDTLGEILTEITAIGTDASANIKAVFDAIIDLADATTDPTAAFDAAIDAVDALITYITSETVGLSVNYGNLDTALSTNEIVVQLEDAFGELADGLARLGAALTALKAQVLAAVTTAGSGTVTKAILRQKLSIADTSDLTVSVVDVSSSLQLIFFILEQSKEFLQLADAYIISSGVAGQDAVDYINEQLQVLSGEVESYKDAADTIKTTVTDTFDGSTDLGARDLTPIAAIKTEVDATVTTFGANIDTAVTAIEASFTGYQADILLVSTGYATFYSDNACGHIFDLVTVLINQGPYAEYCYEKYGDAALALFDSNARVAGECVDREITRLLTLQDVLISIAEQIAFSVEDLLATLDFCLNSVTECNDSDIDMYLGAIHAEIDASHLEVLTDLVDDETDAGLARLQACFVAARYDILREIDGMTTDIAACETNGPNPPSPR
ncbi:hypothetical protein ZHAS_00014413 [Anopheles sinensis]|uniref:Protein TsetseEP domain-containing protein n=1 Tax=Anopheles sinensis TaxID=74873 RepID=A0A084W871_ANOSI|nr:hypothetical protein ZHAS_00014413 [Anopheles sinensis]